MTGGAVKAAIARAWQCKRVLEITLLGRLRRNQISGYQRIGQLMVWLARPQPRMKSYGLGDPLRMVEPFCSALFLLKGEVVE